MKVCGRCGSIQKEEELNTEGRIHHGRPVECKDRKACERRKRKYRYGKVNKK